MLLKIAENSKNGRMAKTMDREDDGLVKWWKTWTEDGQSEKTTSFRRNVL